MLISEDIVLHLPDVLDDSQKNSLVPSWNLRLMTTSLNLKPQKERRNMKCKHRDNRPFFGKCYTCWLIEQRKIMKEN